MNEGVLFVVEPISFVGSISWQNIFGALICSGIFCVFIFGIQNLFFKKIKISSQKNYKFPNLLSPKFAIKIFRILQEYISANYMPKNSFAHTYEDIQEYCRDEKILSLYQELEKIVYQKISLTEAEKKIYLQKIQSIIFRKNP